MTAYFWLRLYTKLASKAAWQLVNRKADFFTIRIDSHNESIRIANWNAVLNTRTLLVMTVCMITTSLLTMLQKIASWQWHQTASKCLLNPAPVITQRFLVGGVDAIPCHGFACSGDSWRGNFFGKHEHDALWLHCVYRFDECRRVVCN